MYYLLPFRFERFEDSELLVNEVGDYLFCPQGTAARIVNREISEDEELYHDLLANFFISPTPIPPAYARRKPSLIHLRLYISLCSRFVATRTAFIAKQRANRNALTAKT